MPTEPLDRRADHPLAVRLVRRVGDDGQALTAGCLDLRDRRVERRLRAAPDDDVRSGLGEGDRQRRSDAAATARDKGHEAIEAEIVESGHRAPSSDLIDYRAATSEGTVHDGMSSVEGDRVGG